MSVVNTQPAAEKVEEKKSAAEYILDEMPFLNDTAVGFVLTPGSSVHPKTITILYLVFIGLIGIMIFMCTLPNVNKWYIGIMLVIVIGLFLSLQMVLPTLRHINQEEDEKRKKKKE
ncbi:PTS system mannose-specific EIIBCA component [Acrasis kona]|uniref:PTS system mannose-specific EIIBCA component n=1 Tax=Acrasis kona TaxID=1008807 RepID=A0AAW2ZI89_9EUKA